MEMAEQESLREILHNEYCPPIDDATFLACLSDYNLTIDDDVKALRAVLEILREAAASEEATGFDPTGTSGVALQGQEPSVESSASSAERSGEHEIESLTTGLSDLTWDEFTKNDRAYGVSWEDLSPDEKEDRIARLLPQINRTTIRWVLRKNNNKFDQSMDELLTLAFLDEEAKLDTERSLEAFAADGHSGRTRRKRTKKHPLYSSVSSSANTSVESLPAKNVWASSKDDIQFVTSRTHLSHDKVASLYHAQGASLPATILEFSVKHSLDSQQMQSSDPNLQIQVVDLGRDFPSIPAERLFGLLSISRNIPSAAHELAEAMISRPVTATIGTAKIVPKYIPVEVLAEASSNTPRGSRSPSAFVNVDHASTRALASAHSSAGQEAFSKASSAYRRGKSDRLMGGAAAYYSEIGREHVKAAKMQSSVAADSLVTSQSTPYVLDLHGVSVPDAVRIASDRIQEWWERLGDAKFASGGGGPMREGYRVITGLGRHSKDGAPKIGPAVTKRLMNEGWKVTIGQGELVITGKRRM